MHRRDLLSIFGSAGATNLAVAFEGCTAAPQVSRNGAETTQSPPDTPGSEEPVETSEQNSGGGGATGPSIQTFDGLGIAMTFVDNLNSEKFSGIYRGNGVTKPASTPDNHSHA